MHDLELIFTMLREKATTEIKKTKNSQGFDEYKIPARKDGRIAQNARKKLEQETGSVVSPENFVHLTKNKKKILEDT